MYATKDHASKTKSKHNRTFSSVAITMTVHKTYEKTTNKKQAINKWHTYFKANNFKVKTEN